MQHWISAYKSIYTPPPPYVYYSMSAHVLVYFCDTPITHAQLLATLVQNRTLHPAVFELFTHFTTHLVTYSLLLSAVILKLSCFPHFSPRYIILNTPYALWGFHDDRHIICVPRLFPSVPPAAAHPSFMNNNKITALGLWFCEETAQWCFRAMLADILAILSVFALRGQSSLGMCTIYQKKKGIDAKFPIQKKILLHI